MKKVLKKTVGLLLAVMMIGSILVGSVSAAEVQAIKEGQAVQIAQVLIAVSYEAVAQLR